MLFDSQTRKGGGGVGSGGGGKGTAIAGALRGAVLLQGMNASRRASCAFCGFLFSLSCSEKLPGFPSKFRAQALFQVRTLTGVERGVLATSRHHMRPSPTFCIETRLFQCRSLHLQARSLASN